MHKIGLFIVAVWPAIAIAQNTYSLKYPNRTYFQSRELSFKGKHNSALQKWEDIEVKPVSILEKNDILLKELSRTVLLREHGDKALEAFFEQEQTNPNRSSTFLLLGLKSFHERNYSASIKYFQFVQVQDLNSDQTEEFYFKTGYSYLMEDQIPPSLAAFNKVKGRSGGYGPAAAYYAGYLEFQNKNFPEAKRNLSLVGDDPGFANIVNDLLAAIYYKEGDADKLIAFADQLGEKGRSKGHIKNLDLLVGDAYFSKGNYPKAWEYFKRSEPRNPGGISAELAYRYGKTLFEIKDYERAEKYLKIGVTKARNDTLAQFCSYYAGMNYSMLGDNASAGISFDKASQYSVNQTIKENSEFNKAKIRIKEGFTSQAIEGLENYIKVYPRGTYKEEATSLLAEAYLNTNRYLEGVHHLEGIQVWNSKNKRSFQSLCFKYASEKFNDRSFDSSIYYYQRSLRFPEDPDLQVAANFWMGEASSIKKRWSKSILFYGRVFALDPRGKGSFYYPSRYGIAFAYFKSKEYDKAKGHYKTYVEKYETKGGRDYEDALLRLGDSYFVTRDYAKAAVTFKKIFNRGLKGRDYAAFRLGEIYWIENDAKQSKTYFGKLITQYPKSPYLDDAIYESANVSFESGDFEVAAKEYSVLLNKHSLSPYVPESLHKRGMSYAGLGLNSKAIKDFRTYLDRYTRNKKAVEVLSSLHEALIHEGRESEFDEDKIAFQKANPESRALESIEFENAKEFHLSGELERAISLLENFLKDYPASSYRYEVIGFLADDYYETGELDSARKYYDLVIEYGISEKLRSAYERISRVDLANGDYQSSINNLIGWSTLAEGEEERLLALEGLMKAYFETKQFDSCLAISKRISNFESPFGNRNLALLFWGKSLLEMGKLDEAKAQFEITVEEATDENAAEAKFLIARIEFQLAEFKESIQTCLDLISSFSHYAEWNDKAYLLIADNFIGLEDLFQARATLESIIQNSPSSETVDQAREKLLIVEEKEDLLNKMVDSIE